MQSKLMAAISLIALGNIVTWLCSNSQFISTWWKARPILAISVACFPASLCFYYGWKYAVETTGELWAARFIGFGTATIVFALMTHFIMNEQITSKTVLCLFLSVVIIMIQTLWK